MQDGFKGGSGSGYFSPQHLSYSYLTGIVELYLDRQVKLMTRQEENYHSFPKKTSVAAKQRAAITLALTVVLMSFVPVNKAAAATTVNIPGNNETYLPNEPILATPDTEEMHLVVSLTRREVTLYREGLAIDSFPVAIGRSGMETPTGTFRIAQKVQNPTWINPWTGVRIPAADKTNPLGHYFIGFWNNNGTWYGFHGTNQPMSVGKAASSGCLRMRDSDIKHLFSQVKLGTEVTIVR